MPLTVVTGEGQWGTATEGDGMLQRRLGSEGRRWNTVNGTRGIGNGAWQGNRPAVPSERWAMLENAVTLETAPRRRRSHYEATIVDKAWDFLCIIGVTRLD